MTWPSSSRCQRDTCNDDGASRLRHFGVAVGDMRSTTLEVDASGTSGDDEQVRSMDTNCVLIRRWPLMLPRGALTVVTALGMSVVRHLGNYKASRGTCQTDVFPA